tara:strand:- start:4088 stop:4954 length:867 start_codon:yes stop_codon:yes gene_type:complete
MELKLNTKVQLTLLGVVLLFVLASGYAIGAKIERDSANQSLSELLSSKEKLYEEVEVVKTRSATLQQSIQQLSDKNTELLDLVAQLQTRPDKIRYVTVTETVIKSADPVVESIDLPSQHIFLLHNNLAVAKFEYNSEAELPYTFETYDLTFKNSIVLSDKNSSALLQIASSADPETYVEFPIDSLEVRTISDQPLFEPHIGVGLTLSASENPDLLGSIFLSFLHPHENVDVLGIRVAANGQTAQFGLEFAGYNIAAHVPVITDLWVHGGIAVDINAKPSGHLSLGTKF